MSDVTHCPECGATWSDSQTCTDHFHMMGFWELEHQLYEQHHLMVLCYYLQHPSLYSPNGLHGAKKLLVDFLEAGISPQAMRQRISKDVDSSTRNYKIKGTSESYGQYEHPIQWEMFAADVIAAGLDNYYASIQKWAEATIKSLRESGNLD